MRQTEKMVREINGLCQAIGEPELALPKQDEPVSRDRFLDVVWGSAAFPTTRTVDKHVASLRNKIEENPEQPRWIQTMHAVEDRLEMTGEVAAG